MGEKKIYILCHIILHEVMYIKSIITGNVAGRTNHGSVFFKNVKHPKSKIKIAYMTMFRMQARQLLKY